MKSISITTDGWTDAVGAKYIAITAHYVHFEGDTLTMNSNCICMATLTARQYANNVEKFLADNLEQFFKQADLQMLYFSATIDNGANFKAAARAMFDDRRIVLCMAHTLNLVVTDAIDRDEFKGSLEFLRQLINHIRHANADARRIYDQACKEVCGKKLALKRDCATRFYSEQKAIDPIF